MMKDQKKIVIWNIHGSPMLDESNKVFWKEVWKEIEEIVVRNITMKIEGKEMIVE